MKKVACIIFAETLFWLLCCFLVSRGVVRDEGVRDRFALILLTVYVLPVVFFFFAGMTARRFRLSVANTVLCFCIGLAEALPALRIILGKARMASEFTLKLCLLYTAASVILFALGVFLTLLPQHLIMKGRSKK